MTIGEKIKMLRKRRNMTQEELAEKAGFKSKSSINKIELGKVDIRRSKLKQMADALGTTTTYLVGVTDDPGLDVTETNEEQQEAMELAEIILKLSPEKVKEVKDFIEFQQSQ